MHRLESFTEARQFVYRHRCDGRTVGLVPTMGALHDGHLSLAKESSTHCDATLATIFVNPTQFVEGEDLDKYPRTIEEDCAALESIGVDAVFIPSKELMYPDGYSCFVNPPDVARRWVGEFRPTHFRGVATIVLKLFHGIPATHAFFGRKDFQQLRVIQEMVRDLNVEIAVVGCETVREQGGLALSSRNRYLSVNERQRALLISQSLQHVADAVAGGQSDVERLQDEMRGVLLGNRSSVDEISGVDQLDYAVIVDAQSLEPLAAVDRPAVAMIAVYVGPTRLIDNRLVSP